MADRLAEIQQAIKRFRMDEARALVQEELEEQPSAAAYYLASQAALNHGQRLEYLRKALELDPTYQQALDEMEDIKLPEGPPEADEPAAIAEEAPAEAETELGSLTKRLFALLTDGVIVGIATFIFLSTAGALEPLYDALRGSDEQAYIAAIAQFQTDTIGVNLVISAVYNVVLMTVFNGRTLGKILFDLRVVKKNGRRINILDAMLRNVLGYTLSQVFLLGYLWAIIDDEQQAWHDKIAGTIVVVEPKAKS